jgi:Alpha galactosidase A/Alpha galactosidase C-terminal beta sandwich domain
VRGGACAVVLLCASAIVARPARAVLAPTPYMGWNTYYGVGGVFNEQTITSVANTLLSHGLARAGYRIVWLDFGWAPGARDGQGNLVVDPTQWPHGLSWLTAYLHQHRLLAGIYTDAGASGCNGQGVGSLGHYQQDADAFAAWGFDAVKVDFCGAGQAGLSPQSLYTQFALALAHNASHRPLLLNVDNFAEPGQVDGTSPSFADSAFGNYQWAPRIAQSWRTDTDVGGQRGSGIQWVDVLRNLDSDAVHPEAAGPGHWNDPDYLGPELGMTPAEAQAQFSMWAVLAAPLILGSDPRALSPASVAMLKNPSVIAIDQDSLGVQGRVVQTAGPGQVWAKRLVGGDRAFALLNRGSEPVQLTGTARTVGLAPAGTYRVVDLWAGRTTLSTGAFGATVAGDSASLYRITALPAVAAVVRADGRLYVHAPQLASTWKNVGRALVGAPVVVALPHPGLVRTERRGSSRSVVITRSTSGVSPGGGGSWPTPTALTAPAPLSCASPCMSPARGPITPSGTARAACGDPACHAYDVSARSGAGFRPGPPSPPSAGRPPSSSAPPITACTSARCTGATSDSASPATDVLQPTPHRGPPPHMRLARVRTATSTDGHDSPRVVGQDQLRRAL